MARNISVSGRTIYKNWSIVERGHGAVTSSIAAGADVDLNAICGITSYWSNYGTSGVGRTAEGFYLKIMLNNSPLTPVVDYRECSSTGTGQTTIQMTTWNLDTSSELDVEVKRR